MIQLIEFQYFGPISAYSVTNKCTHIVLEQYERWQKMSFRNRCQILGSGGVQNLTVPLVGGRNQRALTSTIVIDNSQPWQQQHWRSLETAYNRSPFFLHYADGLRGVIFGDFKHLIALNEAALHWCLKALKWHKTVSLSEAYSATATSEQRDCRGKFVPSNRDAFEMPPYQQVFTGVFQPNLSILDLLFNLGPSATSHARILNPTMHVG